MKGYHSIKQFVNDYNLYMAAKKIDPGKDGETITSYLKKRISNRISLASKQFNNMLKKRSYSINDLKIIATHDYIKHIENLEFFVKECFGLNYVTPAHYKKILSSNAFKAGRLKRLYEFIPLRIETKIEFMRFVRTKRGIPKTELSAIMSYICRNNWKEWLNELIDKGKIQEQGSKWYT